MLLWSLASPSAYLLGGGPNALRPHNYECTSLKQPTNPFPSKNGFVLLILGELQIFNLFYTNYVSLKPISCNCLLSSFATKEKKPRDDEELLLICCRLLKLKKKT